MQIDPGVYVSVCVEGMFPGPIVRETAQHSISWGAYIHPYLMPRWCFLLLPLGLCVTLVMLESMLLRALYSM